MKEKRMKDVLDSIAQQNVPENINIWPQVAAKVERKDFMQTVRTRPAFAMLLVLLALALISTAAYAIGKATGYIPGVGMVDQSMPLRILAEPLVVERDGLTVTVSEVVADTDHTFVAYSVDGILVPREGRPVCGAIPFLQLPNGSMLDVVNLDDGGPQGARVGTVVKLEQSVTYSSIPADVNTVTFTFPCILDGGMGPENWQIPLTVSPAPKNYATPAVEIGATFVSSNPGSATTLAPADASTPGSSASSVSPSNPNGSGLYLDKVIELPDSYILVGNFTDVGDLPGGMVIDLDPYADLPRIEDASGNPVDFKVRDDIQPVTSWADRYWVRNWAYEIPKSVQGPLTITMDEINIGVTNKTQFKFDAGSTPQVGQRWELDLPVRFGTYEYVMDSVEMVEGGYLFKYHSGVDVPAGQSLLFNILGASAERNAGTLIAGETRVEYSEEVTFLEHPTGPLTVELSLDESVPLQGPWTLTWTPPSK